MGGSFFDAVLSFELFRDSFVEIGHVTPLFANLDTSLDFRFESLREEEEEGRVSSEDKNMFIPLRRVYSMNTYLYILTIPQGSERSE